MPYFDILRPPDRVICDSRRLAPGSAREMWSAGDVFVVTRLDAGRGCLAVEVSAESTPVERVGLRWSLDVPAGLRYLGDHWERGYGDLEWRGLVPERAMPWYFLVYDRRVTHGYGVKTAPGAFCFWTADSAGVNLWLDVRNGGAGVELGGRTLRAAEVVIRQGAEGESPFGAACAFCRLLCDAPRLPERPVYGANDWYYAYGHSSAQSILDAARLIVSLSPGGENRPFMVVDAGWQPAAGDEPANVICGGPYRGSNRRFYDMPGLAAGIRAEGALPGIWIRPLAAAADDPDAWLLPVARALDDSAKVRVLDPSLPDALDRVESNFRALHGWGYDLIKHDWASCDIFGRWGFQMGTALTHPGWHFADRSRTTAEITLALFRAIRRGAGDAIVIGCNTVGHLGAGLFDLQRTGDDTSGRDWERTRKMGVNTLAFRMPQHGAFFAADPDCVGHTAAMPWELNRQFLDLVARSGAPLFVSFDPATIGPEQAQSLRAALTAAAVPQPMGEPLDWMQSTCPTLWRLGGGEARYDWYGEAGVTPAQ